MSTGIGDTLREAREDQGRSLEDAARSLRARVTQLVALEEERFDEFGGDVYAKGFLRNYAVDLGLDPEPLLDAYRRQVGRDEVPATQLVTGVPTPTRQRSAPPSWIAWVLVGVVVVAGLTFVGITFGGSGGRTPPIAQEPDTPPPAPAPNDDPDDGAGDGSDEDPDTGGSSGSGDDAEPGTDPGSDSDDEQTDPEPEGVELLLSLEERSWMRVIVDGSVLFEGEREAGETVPYEGDQEIQVRLGNAGGVRVELNGEQLGSLGGRGEVVTVVFTPDGVEST